MPFSKQKNIHNFLFCINNFFALIAFPCSLQKDLIIQEVLEFRIKILITIAFPNIKNKQNKDLRHLNIDEDAHNIFNFCT